MTKEFKVDDVVVKTTDRIYNELSNMNDKQRTLVLVLFAMLASHSITHIYPNKKAALLSGFQMSFSMTYYVLNQMKMFKEIVRTREIANKTKNSLDAEDLDDLSLGKTKYSALSKWITNDLMTKVIIPIGIIIIMYFFSMKYSGKALIKFLKDERPQILYLKIGVIGGLVVALLIHFKKYGVPKKQEIVRYAKEFKKEFIKSFKDNVNRIKDKNSDPIMKLIYAIALGAIVLDLIETVMGGTAFLVRSLKKENDPIEKINQSDVKKAFSNISKPHNISFPTIKQTILQKIIFGLFLHTRRGIPIKDLRFCMNISKYVRTRNMKNANRPAVIKIDTRLDENNENVRKVIEGIKEAVNVLREHGYRVNIPVYIIKAPYLNAYYDPYSRLAAFLVDNDEIKMLSSKHVAAIMLHEFGHAYELKTQKIVHAAIGSFLIVSSLLVFLTYQKNLSNFPATLVWLEILAALNIFVGMQTFYRQAEIAADAFAIKMGYGNELTDTTKLFIDPNESKLDYILHSADVHDHPKRRLKAIRDALKELAKEAK
jgi:hypothetical protein